MRVFTTQSMWDKKEQQWYQIGLIDGVEVSLEEYFQEINNEVNAEEKQIKEDEYGKFDSEECTNLDGCEEVIPEDCECEDCIEKRKIIYLAEAVQMIYETEMCPQCCFEMLQDIYDKAYGDGFDDGYKEMKVEMQDFLED